MKRLLVVLLALSTLLLFSCTSTKNPRLTRFSLTYPETVAHENGFLMGTVNFPSTFYFPSTSDILDISLLRTEGTTGLVSEISHLRYKNLQKFPIPFSMAYDKADVREGDLCTILVTLSIDGSIRGQALTQVRYENSAFEQVSLDLIQY